MRQILLILIMPLLMTSCATVLKRSTYKLNIQSNKSNAKVKLYDSIYSLPAKIKVKRSNKDLNLTLLTDSATLQYKIKSSPNYTFLFLNLVGMQLAPVNYAIDFTNHKRFYYGRSVYLNTNDTVRTIFPQPRKFYHKYFSKTYPGNKGEIYLNLSLPYINTFQFKPDNENTKINTGFWGMTIGLDYYHHKNQFASFYASDVLDFFLPVPAAVDISGEYESMSSSYLSLSNNHKIKRFSVGYGISFSRNTWDLEYVERFGPRPPTTVPVTKSNNAFGLIFSTSFQTNRHFNIGVVYRPTFIRLNSPNVFDYEHLISIDFAWKIRLKK